MTVSLEWHAYKALQSHISLKQYHQWLDMLIELNGELGCADWQMWRDSEGEYADYHTVEVVLDNDDMRLMGNDFWCIGNSINRTDLENVDAQYWILQMIEQLSPLYEACFKDSSLV